MPAWLEAFATWNPMSAVVAAIRQLFGNNRGCRFSSSGQRSIKMVTTLGMSVRLLGVMVPLAVHRYGGRPADPVSG